MEIANEGVATVQRCGAEAHVSAACSLGFQDQVELSKTLRGMGFSAVVFERSKDGKMRRCSRKLSPVTNKEN